MPVGIILFFLIDIGLSKPLQRYSVVFEKKNAKLFGFLN